MTELQKEKPDMLAWLKSLAQDFQRGIVTYIVVGAGLGVWLLAKLKIIGNYAYDLANSKINICLALLLCALCYLLAKLKSKPNLLPEEQPLINWKLHEKITLTIGDYYDLRDKDGKKIIRITLKEISEQQMPPPYLNIGNSCNVIEAETATISFDNFMSLTPGQSVKPITPSMPFTEGSYIFSKNANSEETNSVFFFSTVGQEQFFRCFVEHINSVKQEVEIDVYFLQTVNV